MRILPVRLGTSRGTWVLVAMVLGSSLAGIDATVVNIALPRIGRDLGATFAGLQWTVSAYTLTLASLILWGGALGDRFGRRRVFLIGIGGFTTASVLCAVAPGLQFLIAARALQGAGGALLMPASLAIIQSSFVEQDRSRAVGTWAGFSGVATAIAPFVGGWLLSVASWRWIFVINVPLAIVVVLMSVRHVPDTREVHVGATRSGASDWLGAALTVVGLGGLTWAVLGSSGAGHLGVALLAGATGVIALACFVLVERRSKHPLVPTELFRDVTFSITNATTFILYGALACFFFLLVVELQVVAGFSPLAAGAATLPVTVLTLVLSPWSGQLAQQIGPRAQMAVGPVICAAGVLLTLRNGPGADYWTDVLPALTVFGVGLATFVAPLTSTALSSASPGHAGVASGVNNAVARSGSLLAVAVLPVLVGLTGTAYEDPMRFLVAYRRSVWVEAAFFFAGAAVAAWGLPAHQIVLTVRCRPDPVAGFPATGVREVGTGR